MTNLQRDNAELIALPSPALFYHGRIPEPLNDEERRWLVDQLHRYPERVNEARTCAIGALTDMATTEFCRLMAESLSPQPPAETGDDELVAEVENLRRILSVVRPYISDKAGAGIIGAIDEALSRKGRGE